MVILRRPGIKSLVGPRGEIEPRISRRRPDLRVVPAQTDVYRGSDVFFVSTVNIMSESAVVPLTQHPLFVEMLAAARRGGLSDAKFHEAFQLMNITTVNTSSNTTGSVALNGSASGDRGHDPMQAFEEREGSADADDAGDADAADDDEDDDDPADLCSIQLSALAAQAEANQTCQNPNHRLCHQAVFPDPEGNYDPEIIRKIILHVICGSQHHELCETKWLETGDMTIDVACQQGKTGAALRGCWIAKYCFGYGSAIFLHNDKNAYVQMNNAIKQFNDDIDGVIGRFWPGTHASVRAFYHLKGYGVDDCRGGRLPDDINEFPGAAVLLRCTIPSNIESFVKCAIPYIIGKHGAPTDGSRKLKFACFFDEDQDNYQNASLNKARKERLLFTEKFTESLRRAYQVHFSPQQLEQNLAHWLPLEPGLKNMCELVGDVSATPIAKYLTRKAPTTVLTLELPSDYYGLKGCDPRLAEDRTIETVQIHDSIDDSSLPLLQRHDILPVLEKHIEMEGWQHGLIWTPPSSNNLSLSALGAGICHAFFDDARPVIGLAYYNSCIETPGLGPSLYFNRAAEPILDALLEAEQRLIRTRDQLSNRPEVRDYPGNRLKVGNLIRCDGGEFIFVNTSIERGGYFGVDAGTGVRYVRVPQSPVWKISRLLSLLQRACAVSRIDVNRLFLVTIGHNLIRASVTLKTPEHKLPLTFQIMAILRRPLLRMDFPTLVQIAGRVQGRRADDEGVPIFYAPRYVLSKLECALVFFSRVRQAEKAANGHNLTPLEVIAQTPFPGFGNLADLPCKRAVFTVEHYEAITRNSTLGDFLHVPEGAAMEAQEAMARGRATNRRRFSDEAELEHAMQTHHEDLFQSMQASMRTEVNSGPLRRLLRDILKACRSADEGFGPPAYHDLHDIMNQLGMSVQDRQAVQVRQLLVLLLTRAQAGDKWVRKAQGGNRPRFAPLIYIKAAELKVMVLTDIPDRVFDE